MVEEPTPTFEQETSVTKEKIDESPEIIVIPRVMLNYVVIAVTFLVVGVIVGMTAFSSGNIDEAQLERVMRAVIEDANLASNASGEVNRFELVDDDPYLGAEDAPVVIVEFSDFQCPYCGRHFEQTLIPLIENYGEHIRYVFRDFPQIGPESYPAALAAQCADEQGVFWDFHKELFTYQDELSRDFYIDVAIQLEIDVDAFIACFDEDRYQDEINIDYVDGTINDVRGTPGFFINGEFLRGAMPYEVFERLVLRELDKAGIEVEAAPPPETEITPTHTTGM